MNRSASWVSLGLVACVGGVVTPTPTAHAQTFNDPTFYFWGRYPNGHTPASPKVRQIVKFSLNDSAGGVPYHANVTALAQDIGDYADAEISAGQSRRCAGHSRILVHVVGFHKVDPMA
jgi:hypothetical protein